MHLPVEALKPTRVMFLSSFIDLKHPSMFKAKLDFFFKWREISFLHLNPSYFFLTFACLLKCQFNFKDMVKLLYGPLPDIKGGLTNERPQTDHVIRGPMRGLEKKLHGKGTYTYGRFQPGWRMNPKNWHIIKKKSLFVLVLTIKRITYKWRRISLIENKLWLLFFSVL